MLHIACSRQIAVKSFQIDISGMTRQQAALVKDIKQWITYYKIAYAQMR